MARLNYKLKECFDLYESDREKWKIINLRYFNPIGAHHSGVIENTHSESLTTFFQLLVKWLWEKSINLVYLEMIGLPEMVPVLETISCSRSCYWPFKST